MVFKPAHLVLFDSYTFMSVSMEDEERLYIVAWESVHLDQICICTVRDQICICTVRMANEWEKNVNTLLDFFILFFFFIQLLPGLKTLIYVHDSGHIF